MRGHQLIDPPNLSRLYGRAALGAAVSRIGSNGSLGTLPEEAVLVDHPGASWEQAEQHRRLFGGEVFDGVHRRSLPSVLIHTLGFPVQMALMAQEEFPLPLIGLVHLANEVEHRRPVEPEQPVRIRVHAERLRPHRRGTQVEIVTEVLPADADPAAGGEHTDPGNSGGSRDQEVLWRGVSVYLGRGVHLGAHDEDAGAPEGDADDGGPESPGSGSAGSGSAETSSAGTSGAGSGAARGDAPGSQPERGRGAFVPPRKTGEWRLGADAGREYAALSGDYNPIHLTGITAKALGMPSAIVHGMYSAARMLEGREPEEAGHRWSVVFEAPVRLPGRVAFGVEQPDERTQILTGWNPRKRRRHFRGELHLP